MVYFLTNGSDLRKDDRPWKARLGRKFDGHNLQLEKIFTGKDWNCTGETQEAGRQEMNN
jgi:hypothetical protein